MNPLGEGSLQFTHEGLLLSMVKANLSAILVLPFLFDKKSSFVSENTKKKSVKSQ